MKWWVACSQWVGATEYDDEAKARQVAESLNRPATPCQNVHYYWATEEAPTYNTERGSVNIPKEAKSP